MHQHRRDFLRAAGAGLTAAAFSSAAALAQGRPITLITGYAPGGGSD
jgi:hypothetical protein